MLKAAKNAVKRWSYSSWGLHKKCAAAYYYRYVLKLKEPPFWAMERGTAIHSLAENYLIGRITGMPRPLQKLAREMKGLKSAKPICEQYWGVTATFEPNKRKEDSWCVAKTDTHIPPTKKEPTLYVNDHKTGRIYPEHIDQASLYATIGFVLFPKTEGVLVEFFYFDQGKVHGYEYTRSQLKRQVGYWQDQGDALMAKRKFLPSPSEDACKWCGFRSDKRLASKERGPCKAWKGVIASS